MRRTNGAKLNRMSAACKCTAGPCRQAYQPTPPQPSTNSARDAPPSTLAATTVPANTRIAAPQPGKCQCRGVGADVRSVLTPPLPCGHCGSGARSSPACAPDCNEYG